MSNENQQIYPVYPEFIEGSGIEGQIHRMKKGIILPFLLVLASTTLILGAFFLPDNKPKTTSQNPSQTASPSPADETVNSEASRSVYTNEGSANWKIYNGKGFSFKYPPIYTLESESPTAIFFTGTFDIDQKIPSELVVNFSPSINATTLKECNGPYKDEYRCIDESMKEMTINNTQFREIYLREGKGDSQSRLKYVLQTIDSPNIEFVHLVLGGGVENRMDQILSTFRFN